MSLALRWLSTARDASGDFVPRTQIGDIPWLSKARADRKDFVPGTQIGDFPRLFTARAAKETLFPALGSETFLCYRQLEIPEKTFSQNSNRTLSWLSTARATVEDFVPCTHIADFACLSTAKSRREDFVIGTQIGDFSWLSTAAVEKEDFVPGTRIGDFPWLSTARAIRGDSLTFTPIEDFLDYLQLELPEKTLFLTLRSETFLDFHSYSCKRRLCFLHSDRRLSLTYTARASREDLVLRIQIGDSPWLPTDRGPREDCVPRTQIWDFA